MRSLDAKAREKRLLISWIAEGMGIVGFWLGAVMVFLGEFVTFVPGAERKYFAFAAMLNVLGLLVPNYQCRLIGSLLAAFCVYVVLF